MKIGLLRCGWVEARGLIAEADAARWDFQYGRARHDPTPSIVTLGGWRPPGTHRQLVGGINLNYLDQEQQLQLRRALPQIMQGRDLQDRYWIGRRLLPDQFTNFYRTYNADYVNALQRRVIQPEPERPAAEPPAAEPPEAPAAEPQRPELAAADQPEYPTDLTQLGHDVDRSLAIRTGGPPAAQVRPEPTTTAAPSSAEFERARQLFQAAQAPEAAPEELATAPAGHEPAQDDEADDEAVPAAPRPTLGEAIRYFDQASRAWIVEELPLGPARVRPRPRGVAR